MCSRWTHLIPCRSEDPREKSRNGSRERGTQPVDRSVWPCAFEASLLKPLHSHGQDLLTTQEGYRTKFYKIYRGEAEECDWEFFEKYDGDLNTTLIFVSFLYSSHADVLTWQTGWSILRRDFRVHHSSPPRTPVRPKRGDRRSPPCPHPQDRQHQLWRRCPCSPTMVWPSTHNRSNVQVQAILYACLAASLFSAFLAMLGKQWLNRYASVDMRGSAIERCQNRQRKLILTWHVHQCLHRALTVDTGVHPLEQTIAARSLCANHSIPCTVKP